MVLLSACLLGIRCRYDGKRLRISESVKKLKNPLLLCPEQLGGLPTPRIPAEVKKTRHGTIRVINQNGEDVTEAFIRGAKEVMKVVKFFDIKKAYLKEDSPSCGKEGVLIPLLKRAGVEISWIR